MAKKGPRRTTENALKLEKCSSPACEDTPMIEIRSWQYDDGRVEWFDPPKLLCRKHWNALFDDVPPKKMKVLRFIRDLRNYL